MKTHIDQTKEDKKQAAAHGFPQQKSNRDAFKFDDKRPQIVQQQKLQDAINTNIQLKKLSLSTVQQPVVQRVGRDFLNTLKGIDGAFFGRFHGMTGPLPEGNRSELDGHLSKLPPRFGFPYIVQRLNQSLGVNTEEVLPQAKLVEYKRLATEVSEGTIKDSEAMRQSALGWAKVGHLPATLLNALGAGAYYVKEGAEAHNARKLGK